MVNETLDKLKNLKDNLGYCLTSMIEVFEKILQGF